MSADLLLNLTRIWLLFKVFRWIDPYYHIAMTHFEVKDSGVLLLVHFYCVDDVKHYTPQYTIKANTSVGKELIAISTCMRLMLYRLVLKPHNTFPKFGIFEKRTITASKLVSKTIWTPYILLKCEPILSVEQERPQVDIHPLRCYYCIIAIVYHKYYNNASNLCYVCCSFTPRAIWSPLPMGGELCGKAQLPLFLQLHHLFVFSDVFHIWLRHHTHYPA